METIFAQVVADAWSVDPEDVVISLADTAAIPMGFGTIASRSTVTLSSAIHYASERLREKTFAIAANLLECGAEDLELRDGMVGVKGVPDLGVPLGKVAQAGVNPFRRLFGKPRITSWPDSCVGMRADLLDTLRLDGIKLLATVIGGYLLNGLLLVACLYACGISRSQMPLTLGLMLYAIGRIATIVQITPGGVGITEIAYTAVFSAVLSDSSQPAIVAGVLVYRALTYALPIVTGAFSYLIWRVMRRHEIHEEKLAAEATD